MLSPNDIAQLLRDRIIELERNREKIVFGHDAAIGELRQLLAQIEAPAPVEPTFSLDAPQENTADA